MSASLAFGKGMAGRLLAGLLLALLALAPLVLRASTPSHISAANELRLCLWERGGLRGAERANELQRGIDRYRTESGWALSEIAYWLMGSLANASWTEVSVALPLIAFAMRDRPAPPPEAFQACVEHVEGESCTLWVGTDREVDGTCLPAPDDEEWLACAPAHRAHREPPPAAFDACDELDQHDACSFDEGDRVVDGTCLPGLGDPAELVCVPERGPGRGR